MPKYTAYHQIHYPVAQGCEIFHKSTNSGNIKLTTQTTKIILTTSELKLGLSYDHSGTAINPSESP